MELANARGVRDIDPNDQLLRESVVSTKNINKNDY